jgi:hypothetical protein
MVATAPAICFAGQQNDVVRPLRFLAGYGLCCHRAVTEFALDADAAGAKLLQTILANEKFDIGTSLAEPTAEITSDGTRPQA